MLLHSYFFLLALPYTEAVACCRLAIFGTVLCSRRTSQAAKTWHVAKAFSVASFKAL